MAEPIKLVLGASPDSDRATVLTVGACGAARDESYHIRLAHVASMRSAPMGSQQVVTVQMLAGEPLTFIMSPDAAAAFIKAFTSGEFK